MPRGQRIQSLKLDALEAEMASLKERQALLRREIRRLNGGGAEIQKLQEKLEKQLAGAKWIVQQIQELQPDWDDVGFYQTVLPVQPARRGRRPKQPAG